MTGVAVLVCVCAVAPAAMGATYTFTVVADESGPYASFNHFPAVNVSGNTVFIGTRDGGSGDDLVVGDGTSSSVYASTPFPAEFNSFLEQPSINNNDVVAVYGQSTVYSYGIFSTAGSGVTEIGSLIGLFGGFETYNSGAINDAGFVAFQGDADSGFNGGFKGVYVGNGGAPTAIADQGDGFSAFFGKTDLNNLGQAVFRSDGQLLVGDGVAPLITIADTLGALSGFSDASINDGGLVAFVASLDAGGNGVYTGDGTTLTTIVETDTSDFLFVNNQVAINNSGNLVFQSSLDVSVGGGEGLFTGTDPFADKVIRTGDALLGSTVTDIEIQVEAINDAGQIVFWVSLADGNSAIVRADPDTGPTELQVLIDIKPGSDPNCINNDGNGVIPVAILGSADFDVTQVDPATVLLAGMGIRVAGKSDKYQAHIEDVNNDGFDDLVCQIEDFDGVLEVGSETATLTGILYDTTPIVGSDSICIVPPQ
jgi:hypothetical protein